MAQSDSVLCNPRCTRHAADRRTPCPRNPAALHLTTDTFLLLPCRHHHAWARRARRTLPASGVAPLPAPAHPAQRHCPCRQRGVVIIPHPKLDSLLQCMLARHTAATPAVAAGLAASSVLVVRQCDKCIFGKSLPERAPARGSGRGAGRSAWG